MRRGGKRGGLVGFSRLADGCLEEEEVPSSETGRAVGLDFPDCRQLCF